MEICSKMFDLCKKIKSAKSVNRVIESRHFDSPITLHTDQPVDHPSSVVVQLRPGLARGEPALVAVEQTWESKISTLWISVN